MSLIFQKRIAKLVLATGTKGVGKSFTTYHKELLPVLRGNPALGQPPRRVLIHDPNDEYGEFGVKSIDIGHVPHFVVHPTVEMRRLRPWKISLPTPGKPGPMIGTKMSTGEQVDQLLLAIKCFAGGLLLVEDINKNIADSMPDDLTGAICTNRHIACDIIMHYQSVARPLPKIWQNTTELRFHYQDDDVEHSKGKLQEKTERIKIMQIIVNSEYLSGNERTYIYMNDKKRLIGNFTQEKFMWALEEYILTHPKLLKKYTERRDSQGKKAYNFETALTAHKLELFKLYWGNDAGVAG